MSEHEPKKKVKPESGFRSSEEEWAAAELARIFSQCPDTMENRLRHFPKYIRRQEKWPGTQERY